MCKENALLDKGLSTREAKIRLPLMKRGYARGKECAVVAAMLLAPAPGAWAVIVQGPSYNAST